MKQGLCVLHPLSSGNGHSGRLCVGVCTCAPGCIPGSIRPWYQDANIGLRIDCRTGRRKPTTVMGVPGVTVQLGAARQLFTVLRSYIRTAHVCTVHLLQIVVFSTGLQCTAALDVLFAMSLRMHTCAHLQNDLFFNLSRRKPQHTWHRSSRIKPRFRFFRSKQPKIPMRTRVHMRINAQNAGQRALIGQYLGEPRSYWMG